MMLEEESKWIGQRLVKLASSEPGLSLLNVGSSSGGFREFVQPHINSNIFSPLIGLCSVDHLDVRAEEGVDLVGDLMNPEFIESLSKKNYDALLCANLLEHVLDPEKVSKYVESIVKDGGSIIVTVPYSYPYHNDPIDTMFRPDINELAIMFSNSEMVEGEILQCEGTHLSLLARNKELMLRTLIRWLTPFYKFNNWKRIVTDIPRILQPFSVTCVLLRKRETK